MTTRRGLPAYLVTATLSRAATESAGPAVLVGAIATLGSATSGSYLVASLTASAAVAGPVVGALIDRSPAPRRAFAAAMVVMALGLAAMALLLDRAPLGWVMAIAVVAGLGYPALTGAWSAQLPHLVPTAALTRAYASDAATYSVAAVAAPPAATALVGLAATAPMWLTVAVLLLALGSLRWVPLGHRVQAPHTDGLKSVLRDGMRAIGRQTGLRRSTVITTIGFAGQAAVFVSAPVLAEDLGQSLAFTGVILGTFAVGGVLTAAWFARRPVQRPDRAIIISTLVAGLALAGVGLAPTAGLLLAFAFVMGAAEPPLVSAMFQIRVRESPQHVQAQVFTTSASLRMSAFAAATAACGWLLGHVGLWATIGFGVTLHLASVVIGVLVGPPVPHRQEWLRRP